MNQTAQVLESARFYINSMLKKKPKKKPCNICKAHSCYSGTTDISSISNERHSSFACEHSHVHL